MSSKRYTDEFKKEAIKQVTERGYPASEVPRRLGVTTHNLYAWLRAELRRVEEERDTLKKGRRVLCQGVRVRYAFIRDHRDEFRVARMCRVLKVERSGFYAWLAQPQSIRALEDARLKPLIEAAYLESGGVYGSRNVYRDLREAGESVGRGRERLMRAQGMRSIRTPRRHRYQPSSHAYPEKLPAIEYAPGDTVVRVTWNGEYRAFGRKGKVSNALMGLDITLRPASQNTDGVYDLFFCHQRIGKLDLHKS